MNNKRPKKLTFAMIVLSTTLGACGGNAYREASNTSGTNGTSETPSNTGTSSGTTTAGTTGTVQSPTVLTSSEFLPSATYSFTLTGAGGTHPTENLPPVVTDNILKVKVIAGSAGPISIAGGSTQYSGYTATYACVSFKVTVLGKSVQSDMLSVNGGSQVCPNAPTEQVIDFSDRLGAGHNNSVSITVSSALYDFACEWLIQNPWWPLPSTYGGCNVNIPLKPLFKNHVASGSLDVQLNMTH
ncbi:hypothetical protein WDW86_15010 [Bdellovibrionota bacterium FG-2]